MKLAGIDWVFFDVGFTLINEDDAAWDRFIQVRQELEAQGFEVSTEAVASAVEAAAAEYSTSPVSQAIAKLTGSFELGESLKPKFVWRKELEKPYPDAERVLAALSRQYNIGVIANQSAGTKQRLESWGLLRYLSLVIASAESGLAKPDLAIFELAMERAESIPSQTVMIGDRVDNDIEPAKSLGWKTIRVKQGISRGQVPIGQSQIPDIEIHRLGECLEILL